MGEWHCKNTYNSRNKCWAWGSIPVILGLGRWEPKVSRFKITCFGYNDSLKKVAWATLGIGTGKITQSVQILRAHVKGQVLWYMSVTPALEGAGADMGDPWNFLCRLSANCWAPDSRRLSQRVECDRRQQNLSMCMDPPYINMHTSHPLTHTHDIRKTIPKTTETRWQDFYILFEVVKTLNRI